MRVTVDMIPARRLEHHDIYHDVALYDLYCILPCTATIIYHSLVTILFIISKPEFGNIRRAHLTSI